MLAAAALRLRSALPRASQLWAAAPPLTQHARDFRTKSRLSRPWKHRIAMLKNMVTSLIVHEKIKTTHAKAKECMRLFDRMVTLAKRGTDPEASRLTQLRKRADASKYVKTKEAYAKLFSVLAVGDFDDPRANGSRPASCCSRRTRGSATARRCRSSRSSTGR